MLRVNIIIFTSLFVLCWVNSAYAKNTFVGERTARVSLKFTPSSSGRDARDATNSESGGEEALMSSGDVGPDDEPVSYVGYQLLTVMPQGRRQRKAVIKLAGKDGVHFWLAHHNTSGELFAQILLSPAAVGRVTRRLRDKGVNYRVVLHNLQNAIDDEVASTRDAPMQLSKNGHSLTWQKYHRLDDIYSYLEHEASANPHLGEVLTIGQSTEGRDLRVLRLGKKTGRAKPAMWIDGGIHAREWISPAVVTYLIRELLADKSHPHVLDSLDVYFMPVLNPDGYEYSHTKDRLWRKTRSLQRPAGNSSHGSLLKRSRPCYGVDANRNWDSHWGERAGSKDPCSHNYPGPHAFSEPETKAVSEFLMQHAPSIKSFLTLHSYSQLWLMPWGFTSKPSVFDPQLRRVALRAVEAIQQEGGHLYTPGSIHNVLYPISGGSMDWAHEKAGIRYSFLVELRDTGDFGFVLPPSEIEPTGRELMAAFRVLAEAAQEDEELSPHLPSVKNPSED